MIDPPISELLKKTSTRYSLVILAAKRARQFGNDPEMFAGYDKAILKAMSEIADGKIQGIMHENDMEQDAIIRKRRAKNLQRGYNDNV